MRTQRADRLMNDLSKMTEANDLIYVDGDLKVWQNMKFDVKLSSGETTAVIDKNGVKTTANNQIKVAERFFRIGIVQALPYTYYKRDPKTKDILRDGKNQPLYEGYCIDFINELSRKMNFSFELVEATEGDFGRRLENGSFDGMPV